MSKSLRREITVGLVVSVVSGLIVIYLTDGTLTKVGARISGAFFAAWNVVVGTTPIPRWLLGLLIVLSVIPVSRAIRRWFFTPEEATFLDYKEDIFEGLRWRWGYQGGAIEPLWCFCRTCDTVLVYSEEDFDDGGFGREFRVRTSFTCERCGEKKATLNGRKAEVVARITRLIDRAIRVGEWKNVVEKKGRAASNE